MRHYIETVNDRRPSGRTLAIQVGFPGGAFDAWLDTGYEHTRFEFTLGLRVGPWRYSFDWAVAA